MGDALSIRVVLEFGGRTPSQPGTTGQEAASSEHRPQQRGDARDQPRGRPSSFQSGVSGPVRALRLVAGNDQRGLSARARRRRVAERASQTPIRTTPAVARQPGLCQRAGVRPVPGAGDGSGQRAAAGTLGAGTERHATAAPNAPGGVSGTGSPCQWPQYDSDQEHHLLGALALDRATIAGGSLRECLEALLGSGTGAGSAAGLRRSGSGDQLPACGGSVVAQARSVRELPAPGATLSDDARWRQCRRRWHPG